MTVRCVCGCGKAAANRHHCLTRQVLRREGGDPRDERNLVPVAYGCHAAHHARVKPLPLRVLPDSVFEFAVELLGGGPAWSYLSRYYAGRDSRLDALLEDAA